jgi:hypothetical protein
MWKHPFVFEHFECEHMQREIYVSTYLPILPQLFLKHPLKGHITSSSLQMRELLKVKQVNLPGWQ